MSALLRQRMQGQSQPSAAALKVIRYIERNPAQALTRSAAQIAGELGVSDATVIRAVQGLGFDGMAALRQTVAATLEGGTPAARLERTLGETGADAERAMDMVFDAHQDAMAALRDPKVKERLNAAIRMLGAGDRIAVFGIGPSGVLARYAAMLLTRCGRPARCLDGTGIALADQLLDLRAGDALLLLAYDRPYPEVTATIAEASRLHLPMVLITDGLEARFGRLVDVVVPVQRGRSERVALHGTTLVVLEALILGLTAIDRSRALATLEQLNALRAAVLGTERFKL